MTWQRVSSATLHPSTVYQKVTLSTALTPEEKHRRESEAMITLTSLLPGPFASSAETLHALFDEYEAGTSKEAVLVKDVDKYELLVQAVEYERDSVARGDKLEGLKDLSTFFGVRNGITTELVKGWAADVMKERDELWKQTNGCANGDDA
jgi:putative hydrolase of HD superfamily